LLSGGAAGAVSRITGTLGKGIAALTMDDKYQQERRQAMGKKPVNVKEGLTRGGKGLLEVGLLQNVVTSKFAVNIVLFVCQLLHYYHSKKSEIGKIHPPRLPSVAHSFQHLSITPFLMM